MGPSVFSYVIFRMFDIMGSFSAITLPLFVFMANMISKSGIAEDLLATFYNWAGSVRGSLAAATVFACALIGAMVGTAGGDIIIVGLIALPYMLQQGYDKSLACGSVLGRRRIGRAHPAQHSLHHIWLTKWHIDWGVVHGRCGARNAARRAVRHLHPP